VIVMAGPANPKISPDGTRIAYWISVRGMVTYPIWDPGCSYQDTDYTIVSRVDRFTEAAEFGAVRDYRDPTWIGNDRLLVFNHGLGVMQGAISPVGAGEAGLLQWFDSPLGIPQVGGGGMSRQGDRLAAPGGVFDVRPGAGERVALRPLGAVPDATGPEVRDQRWRAPERQVHAAELVARGDAAGRARERRDPRVLQHPRAARREPELRSDH
jgi:hypothetical protein